MTDVADRTLQSNDGTAAAPGLLTRPRTTATLARFVAETPYSTLPASVIDATKRMILDEIVVTAATHNTPMAAALRRLKLEQGGAPEATLVVDGTKLPAQSAAYVHAQLANLLDADETMLNRMHVVSPCVFAGLAMAEKLEATGEELIAAVALGYDITARIGLSLSQFVPDGKGGMVFAPLFGWAWMTFGATATVCRLMKLDALQTARAFGQALVTSPATFDVLKMQVPFYTDGEPAHWHKYQLCGPAAEAAINAALLSSYGWVAADDVFDEGSEFWRSYGAVGCDWDALYGRLGEAWYIGECAIKPYPFCRFGHAALDILTDIVRKNALRPEDIDSILCRFPPHQLFERLMELQVVDEGLKLMSSQPTAMALVALGIPPGPKWFEADLRHERVRSIARKVRHEVVPEWGQVILEQQQTDGYMRRLPTQVIVTTKDGAVYRGAADFAKGDPWNAEAAMSDEELGEKAFTFLDGILPRPRIEQLTVAVLSLDTAPNVSAIAAGMRRD